MRGLLLSKAKTVSLLPAIRLAQSILKRKFPSEYKPLQKYFWRGLYSEGNFRFKIDWASLIAGSKLTVFALFYFVFEGKFPGTSPPGAYTWRGDLTKGFLRYRFGGPMVGGAYTMAYTWRGLFSEFYGNSTL